MYYLNVEIICFDLQVFELREGLERVVYLWTKLWTKRSKC